MSGSAHRHGRRTAVVAGACLGAAWGALAASPELTIFFSLPGDVPEALYERVLRGVGQWITLPPRTLTMAGIHATFGACLGLLVAFVARQTPILRAWLRWGPARIGAPLAVAAALILVPLWLRRGIDSIPIPWLATGAALALWTAGATAIVCRIATGLGGRRTRALVLLAAAMAAVGAIASLRPRIPLASGGEPGAAPRLLLIAVDAASWANLESDLAAGALPTLAALRERGAWGDLHTLEPILSPVVWTTIATGVEPERHGILDFTLAGVPYTSNSRLALALWEVLPRFGLRSAFHGWWASWPAEDVAGRIVTDRFNQPELDGRVSPIADLLALDAVATEARRRSVSALDLANGDARPDADRLRARHASKLRVLTQILEDDEVMTSLGETALREDFQLVAVYLRAIDAVGHKFWSWHLQDSRPLLGRVVYGVPDDDQANFGTMVTRVHRVVAAQVGRLLAAAGPDTNVVIVSDHGMTTSTPQGAPGQEGESGIHHRSGVILMAGPDVEPGARIRGATVYDVFPSILYLLDLPIPEGLPGRVLVDAIRSTRPMRVAPAFELRNVADPRPIPTESDEGYLEGLRALGYVVD